MYIVPLVFDTFMMPVLKRVDTGRFYPNKKGCDLFNGSVVRYYKSMFHLRILTQDPEEESVYL